jgi:signal transduction histidine kinase/DNA-binding response OmpR family regulator/ligand-binding sensor domain-containing protein
MFTYHNCLNNSFCIRMKSAVVFFVLSMAIFTLLWFTTLTAQEKLLPVFIFHQLTNQDGVRNYEIRSDIIRDQQGLIWFGTANGLFRYDGYSCKAYYHYPNDSNSISVNGVIALHCDRAGRLWIGTWEAGLSLYNSEKDQFINFLPQKNDTNWIQSKSVNSIYEDRIGNIWLGTSDGVVLVNTSEFPDETDYDSIVKKIRFRTFKTSRLKKDVWDINNWDENNIVAASTSGIYLLDKNSGKISSVNIPPTSGLILDTVISLSMYRENKDRLWISSSFHGLFLFDQKAKTLRNYHKRESGKGILRDDPITDLQIDNHKLLWIGTEKGLDLFDPISGLYVDYLKYNLEPPPSQVGMKLSFDNQGTLWIGTGENSVYLIPRCSFRLPYYGLGKEDGFPRQVESLYPWMDGTLWIGSEGKAFNLQVEDLRVLKIVDIFKGEKATYGGLGAMASYFDKKGTIWYGGWGVGLFKFQPITGLIKKFNYLIQLKDLPYKSNGYFSMDKGVGDTLWIATYADGVIKFDPQTEQFSKFSDKQLSAPSGVMKDNSNNIWISDDRDGLFLYHSQTGITEHLKKERVRCTYQDAFGRIWVGAQQINLWQPETKSFKQFLNNEFSDALITEPRLCDSKGRIWIKYLVKGLGILDPATGMFTNFDISDGLCGGSITFHQLIDGRVMIVGYGGMNIVNPDSIFTLAPPPPFVITRMTVNDSVNISAQKTTQSSQIQLSYHQNVIELEFAAIDPGATHLIEYLYRLEGLEDNWIKPVDRRFVRYTGLNPGEYIFRVKAINKHGRWKDQEIALAITILPPWWKTWWAYAFYGFFVIGLLYTGYRLRLRQVHLKQQMEMEHFQTEHLAEVDRLKSRFFSNISHEFRTPLTLILGPADQALEANDMKTVRQKLSLIKDNAKKLFGLVNQLLDFSRLESGVMKLQVSSGDVVRFLRRVVMSFESWAERKKISLQFTSDVESAEGFFDADKLEKIVNNLMSNALKFTPEEGGRVSVNVGIDPTLTLPLVRGGKDIFLKKTSPPNEGGDYRGGQKGSSESIVVISVTDTGSGISPEHLPHIFDRFYRADETHTTEGTGIGLALTKELVDLHHGSITAESISGKGSTFTVKLPIDKSTYAPDEIVETRVQRDERVDLVASSEVSRPDSIKKSTDGKPIVLIVEDNADLRAYIREYIDSDYSVSEAPNGKIGYEIATETVPDIVISDVMMPEMDGIELCKALKQDLRTSHIPVILLTARAGTDSKIEGLEIGADDYVTKPFDSKELLARVKNLIEQRKQLRKKFSAGVVLKPGEVAVTSLDDSLLKKVMSAVEKNIADEDFGVDDLAKEACLSRAQLNRKLHALTNLSPAEFIRYVRLQRAKELLEKNSGNIADIAYQVGFGSPAYFSTCFHERFGYPPSEVHHKDRQQ